jgi:outer membrane protein assembly factor BamB
MEESHLDRGADMKNLFALTIILAGIATGAGIAHTIDAPDDLIIGLAWQDDGTIWAVDNGSGWVYKLSPTTGSILFSFYPEFSASYTIYSVACNSDTLFVNFGKATGGGQHSMYDTDTGAFLSNVPLC